MNLTIGILCVAMSFFYAGQQISAIDFPLAQRLGLQESADHVDALFSRLEPGTARWDLFVLWLLPVAGILMLREHPLWPIAALVGGAFYVDTGGREAFKWLGLRGAAVRPGSAGSSPSRRRPKVMICPAIALVSESGSGRNARMLPSSE